MRSASTPAPIAVAGSRAWTSAPAACGKPASMARPAAAGSTRARRDSTLITTMRNSLPTSLIAFLILSPTAIARSKPYRLPAADLKQRVIWGSVAEAPDGFALSFGGQDQDAQGRAHTRVRAGEKWESVFEQLNRDNPW